MTAAIRLGIDIGTMDQAAAAAPVLAAIGAGLARFGCPLMADEPVVGNSYLATAREAVENLLRHGIDPLVVIDGRMTVVPEGPAVLGEQLTPQLLDAWRDELVLNTRRLVEAVGSAVPYWEILPAPNGGGRTAFPPGRWAELVAAVAEAIRAACPRATILAGALVSNELDDGIDYLRAATYAGREGGWWKPDAPPFDYLAVQFRILPEGAPADTILRAAFAERIQRLWRAAEQLANFGGLRPKGIVVSSLSWDADKTGEQEQANSLRCAAEALMAEPSVRAIVWSSLADTEGVASGLFRGRRLDDSMRRPAWQTFRELVSELASLPEPLSSDRQDVSPSDVVGTAGVDRSATAAPAAIRIRFTIPNTQQVLQAMGLQGEELAAVLSAVAARYGDPSTLRPGTYDVELPKPKQS